MKSILRFILIQLIMSLCVVNSLRIHSQSNINNVPSSSSNVVSVNTKYYDNLNSPLANYYYGLITQQAYEMRIKLYKLDNYVQCNATTLYANFDLTKCIACPKDTPLFNLGTRTCEPCKAHYTVKCDALIVNLTQPFNTTVNIDTSTPVITNQQNKIPNTTLIATSKNVSLATSGNISKVQIDSSSAGTKNPIVSAKKNLNISQSSSAQIVEWQPAQVSVNTSTTSSDFSSTKTPIANITNNTSTYNTSPTKANITSKAQVSNIKYPAYLVVDNSTVNKTINSTVNQTVLVAATSGANTTFANKQCPQNTPFYNITTQQCQACQSTQEYVPNDRKCEPIIYISNPQYKYAILNSSDQLLKVNADIVKTNPQRTVSICPIDKPIAVKNVCLECEANQIFNLSSQGCQNGCASGQIFSVANSDCIKASFITNPQSSNILSPIKDFQTFRSSQKLLDNGSSSIQFCPITTPFLINQKCDTCPNDKPLYNIETKQCQNCGLNRNYDGIKRKCIAQFQSGIQVKKIIPNIF